ncbi:DUF1203 domain-containing protein [Kordiimonas sp.]|uniref:DUF1203 domain-containing protein n=1 Tax=Kordiimonas sp. TaxID=1970157 RepID=UPI003A8D9F93
MTFVVTGLDAGQFECLYGLSDDELLAKGARAYVSDAHPGFPCRVQLKDMEPGSRVILLNYAHLDVPTPYNAKHAIFVTDGAVTQTPEPGQVPEILKIRQLISLRAFDAAHMMVEARVVAGEETADTVRSLFADQQVSYIHAHTAGRGCYLARIDRA